MLIKVRYLGPTNFKGSRYRVSLFNPNRFPEFRPVTVPFRYGARNSTEYAAIEALARWNVDSSALTYADDKGSDTLYSVNAEAFYDTLYPPPGPFTHPGTYGILPVTNGELTCGTCGTSWNDDVTPASRCPREGDHR